MAPVIDVSRDELLARRVEILRRIDLDESGFELAHTTRSLSTEEWEAKEELDEIEFLLGADD
ncbi:MAG: hypothetical protein ABS61_02150 [Microbacterium sp. SCN 70-18]|uniref:Uncharacterized protein n=1 Tax=Microbacterium aurantiacum TaxID=162393 RepID=A0AAJ2HJ35_9MICO|nr:hypothetical protein [Microbacterium aurantiacum]MBN9201248.1 hypothetical protein [Microbacterium chocolatum]MDS0245299.1 hypothetical protein [Microbacterium aurantiacum]ODT11780.1 MAG: hypothetical protein ABS61_02150 [Microbacterium sp. SCN 70-18]